MDHWARSFSQVYNHPEKKQGSFIMSNLDLELVSFDKTFVFFIDISWMKKIKFPLKIKVPMFYQHNEI